MLNGVHRFPPIKRHAAVALKPPCGQIASAVGVLREQVMTRCDSSAIIIGAPSTRGAAFAQKWTRERLPVPTLRTPEDNITGWLASRTFKTEQFRRTCGDLIQRSPRRFSSLPNFSDFATKSARSSRCLFKSQACRLGAALHSCPSSSCVPRSALCSPRRCVHPKISATRADT
jgi:hypothetical protein